MSASDSIKKIMECLCDAEKDAEKHDRGVDAAGAPLRKKLQEVVVCCKEMRAEVQEERNSRKSDK